MTIKEQLNELKSAYVKARSNKEKERIFNEMSELAANYPKEYGEAYYNGLTEAAEDVHCELFRQRVKPLLKTIQAKAIAERMGKSGAWFTQRMNGNIVNGNAQRFKREEMEQIEQTIRDIGHELSQFKAFNS